MWRKIRPHLAVVASYAVLAVLATWPLITKMTTHFPSADEWYGGDPHLVIWFLDWLAKSLTGETLIEPGRMIFFPGGIDPWAGYDGVLMTLIGVPTILAGASPVLAYDLIILTCFVAAALSAYALVLALTRSLYAAWFAGFAYGFSTYLLVRGLQHPNLCLALGVPLIFLAAWRFGNDPNRKNAWWLAAAVLLNGLTSFYYHVGALVFLLVAAVHYRRRLRRHLRVSLLAAALACAAALLPALPILFNRQPGLQPFPLSFVSDLGADPINFVLPHPLTNIFGRFSRGAYDLLPRASWGGYDLFETTSYFGPVLIGLAAVWWWRRKKMTVAAAGLWSATALVFLVLSIGTHLRLGPWRLPMPFLLLRQVPPFSLLRSPNRLFLFALLAVIILASFALLYLRSTVKNRFWFLTLNAVLFSLMVAERLIIPYPLVTDRVPEFYRTAALDGGTYAIADLPITYPGTSEYDYFQTIHGKPIVGGEYFYTAYGPDTASFMLQNPLLRGSVCQKEVLPEPERWDRREALRDLAAANVRFVAVHNLLLVNGADCERPRRFIRDFFAGVEPYFTDGEITVYELPDWERTAR